MFTKRINIDGQTYLFNGTLVKGEEHPNGHWYSMDFSLRFNCILSNQQVQFVLNNPGMFEACKRMVVKKDELAFTIYKESIVSIDFIVDDPGEPSVGLFPAQTNVSILISPSEPAAIDEEVTDFWRQSVADFLDAPGCVQTVSEFNLEQERISKFESEQ